MLRCVAFAGVFGLSLYGSLITPARPEQNKGRDIVYESARNRIGLLRFCRSTALLDRSTADVAIKISERGLNALPTPETRVARAHGDDAQAQGEAGVLGPDGKRDIADFAVHFKTTPGALCKEWAAESLRGVKGRSLQQQAPQTTSAAPPTVPAEIKRPEPSRASSPPGETTGSISDSPGPTPLQSFAPVRQFDGHGWYK
jgi:hypothetical protein